MSYGTGNGSGRWLTEVFRDGMGIDAALALLASGDAALRSRLPHPSEGLHGDVAVLDARGQLPDTVARQVWRLLQRIRGPVLVHHAGAAYWEAVRNNNVADVRYEAAAGMVVVAPRCPGDGPRVVLVAAGTSDLYVIDEAEAAAQALGCPTRRLIDVGVAGLHRLLASTGELLGAGAVIVAAGMEGALPPLVARLVSCPVVAVPTSVGYGVSRGGLAASVAMLCSGARLSVSAVDDGVGAAVQAFVSGSP